MFLNIEPWGVEVLGLVCSAGCRGFLLCAGLAWPGGGGRLVHGAEQGAATFVLTAAGGSRTTPSNKYAQPQEDTRMGYIDRLEPSL